MLFNSHVFIVLFLPITWLLYFGLNHYKFGKAAQFSLILCSFIFYGYQDPKLCLLLLFTIMINYILHVSLTKCQSKPLRNILLMLGILFNLGLLFYYKYLNFSLTIINNMFSTDFFYREIALPLGISFFTFQQISMLADSAKSSMETYSFMDYALYVSFFPQLIAGPIVLHQQLIPQFHDPEKKKINYANLMSGMEYFIIGLAKKVLIADSFARICDAGYDKFNSINTYSTILTILAFTLQIYFDFSGYCDMAKGIGRLFNLEIPINFNSPYKATSIDEFWQRWHITLSNFLTQYLYIPLGGNRKGKIRTYLNILIVFTLSGLWHGAGWTYILWGVMHGLVKVIYRFGKKAIDRIPKWVRWAATFAFVNFAWIFFRADYFTVAYRLLLQLKYGGGGLCDPAMLEAFCGSSTLISVINYLAPAQLASGVQQIWVAVWFLLSIFVCVRMPSSHEMVSRKIRSPRYFVYLSFLFLASFISLSQVSKFIYFNF